MLIIFDLDDTLIDTSRSINPRKFFLALKKMQEKGLFLENIDVALEELLKIDQTTFSSSEALQKFLSIRGADQFFSIGKEALAAPLTPEIIPKARDGAMEMIKDLSSKHQLALVTMGKRAIQLDKLRKAGIDSRLFHIIRAILTEDKGRIYQKIILPFKPSEVVVCGDRIDIDLTPAKKLGLWTIHLRQGRGCVYPKGSQMVDFEAITLKEVHQYIEKLGDKK